MTTLTTLTTSLLRADGRPDSAHLARRVAQAIGNFEHALLGRVPRSVTVVAGGTGLVVGLHESFSPLERGLVAAGAGRRIEDFHRDIFDSSRESLVEHVRGSTGVDLDAGIVHVDAATGSILKTFTTDPAVELFLLGAGLPALGVPVNAHLHAQGATGTGAGRS